MRTRAIILSAVLACVPLAAFAGTDDVDALVESVRQEALKEAAHDEERINDCLAARDRQREMLRDAREAMSRLGAGGR